MSEVKDFYRATVSERSYKDNFENGEVDGTYQFTDIAEKVFDTIEEAVKWFKDNYESSAEDCFIFHEDNNVYAPRPMQTVDSDGSFMDASEATLEKWKDGKIDLYDVEYVLVLHKMTPVDDEDLEKVLNEIDEVRFGLKK